MPGSGVGRRLGSILLYRQVIVNSRDAGRMSDQMLYEYTVLRAEYRPVYRHDPFAHVESKTISS